MSRLRRSLPRYGGLTPSRPLADVLQKPGANAAAMMPCPQTDIAALGGAPGNAAEPQNTVPQCGNVPHIAAVAGGYNSARGRDQFLLIFTLFVAVLLAGCSDYPRDVQQTLDSIGQEELLQVGVIENPPWVIRGESGPEGLEPEIVRKLAHALNAEVRWHWGATAEVMQALEQYQVALVIGGLTTGPHLPKTVAATKPYFTTRYTVGFPASREPPASLEGEEVAVRTLSPAHKPLQDQNAVPLSMEHPERSGLPLAGPDFKLLALGYRPGDWQLLTQKQVMAVAKGENAWMGTLQRHLNGLTGLDQRLRQLEDAP
ncbi:transporter substrate-binding domain-containing protein [Kineobactrum salinum]|uniref:Transporter substrate-binding domain-containing protein n=1 Tax=Kineobactrum salinum TaxID=2708301 RepID=A0A6C0TYF1_9GAMM|nr:transporter substrate-binding domain-containing protein [Kineobactrum salinum]QIB64419.1 transporter substrate-binding domain-containing protein [Kineobactrum salinum]